MGGLVALSRGEAHLAGSHLLDPESGEYNIKYVRQVLPDITGQNHCFGRSAARIDGCQG